MPDQLCDCGHHWGSHDGDQYGCIECRCNLFDTGDGVAISRAEYMALMPAEDLLSPGGSSGLQPLLAAYLAEAFPALAPLAEEMSVTVVDALPELCSIAAEDGSPDENPSELLDWREVPPGPDQHQLAVLREVAVSLRACGLVETARILAMNFPEAFPSEVEATHWQTGKDTSGLLAVARIPKAFATASRGGVTWSGPVLRVTESSIDLGVNGRVRGIPLTFHGPSRESLAVTVVAPKAEPEPEPVLVHACTEHRLPLHRHDGGLLYAACTGDAGCWITGHPRCAHHPEEN